MGGAIKSAVNRAGQAANALVGNKPAETPAAAPVEPSTPVAPAAAPALAPQEAVIQRRKRGRAASLLSADGTSAPQTASKALLGE